ncbi:hypothetical protein [Deinococcus soli (ex Cha et al. 2016)]|uniref:DNA methylase N-4/N-6 domain-containing protein n=2 Tax=Deinococcus soli (ex Cha et al. 2016) TaxID=1309411 RepID=A0AAE3XDF1_9DEIO|nr:hypothetical protein [Deinococcus soli (ex Cha et al. 2016)]MDR6218619.1 hypothetical protein [Deinococcus soli (ex Cha et al. 2016)]MDR6328416.1 hypothetical protein [Deinococcus soli (ex Cha et al. 2016)]MDR6753027.1 hypothetical protein [Deinococcus soli (ex Cha et al. 2016)]
MSIYSFPDRGPWGRNAYRGNASGHLYKSLFDQLKPASFIDPMAGSGTSLEVAQTCGIQAWGLDLNPDFPQLVRAAGDRVHAVGGFNALRDRIVDVVGQRAELVVSHPPYGKLLPYSGQGGMWGAQAHPDDLSHMDDDAFMEALQHVMLNQRDATTPGGLYGCVIGDWRRAGQYTSYQAELIARMPRELAGVLIKGQHNTTSGRQSYGRMRLPMITHEYVVLFERREESVYLVLADVVTRQAAATRGTWRNVVRLALQTLGGRADLSALYAYVGDHPRASGKTHWKEKVRQTLQLYPEFQAADRGVWTLHAA